MKKVALLSLIATLIFAGCEKPIPSFKDGILVEEFIYDTAGFPSCHAATLAETPEGLVYAFFGGTRERNPDVCIYLSRKVDNQWTAPQEVANGLINDTLRHPTWNPVLFQIPEGDLLLFYKVGTSPKTWHGMIMRSKDNGKSWSKPDSLPPGFIGPVKNKPELLANGTLICPSSTEGSKGWRVHMEYSEDLGKTWTKSEPINNPKVYNAIQPSILTYGDGKLQILCRTKNAVVGSAWSNDNGKTWGLMQPSGLPGNQSGTDAVTLSDGRQLIVYNHVKMPIGSGKGHRTPLNVAVSNDGKNWEAALVLEDSEISQYSYPAVIQGADGMVHIGYTWRRQKMKYVKIDPSKLKTKAIENEIWPAE